MTETAVELERQLVHDLDQLGERFVDEKFSTELYRALANRIWRRSDLEGHVSLSWGRAEEIVNSLRDRHGHAPLELAQTGGEGDISRTVGDDLERLGWTTTPLNTGRHDPEHAGRPESPPPRGTGEAHSPVEDSRGWEREAHREAEDARIGGAGPPQTQGEHAGGGRVPSDKA